MKAIKRGKIYSGERVRLETVIPLEVPFAVQIDICSACNMKCRFCFHSDSDAIKCARTGFGFMPYELFTHIIDDIRDNWGSKNRKIKKLRLFKIGEPLLNPNVCRMVKYAKEADIAECIEITTNGTLLNEEMNIGLIEAGIDILNISVNGINEKQYMEACNYKISYDDFRSNIEHFFRNSRGRCKIFIKYSDVGYSEEEKKEFYNLFGDICDEIFVETISATLWQDTNINIVNAHKGIYGQDLIPKQVCPFLFTTMVVNNEGIAHLCCVDWKSEYVLGDLNQVSVKDIWNGEKLREFQKLHLKKQKELIRICRDCESLAGSTIDDIDEYAEAIAERMFGSSVSISEKCVQAGEEK